MKRLLLADDHAMVAEGLRGILQREYDVVGMALDGRDLVEKVAATKPDVVVLDVSMPELNGIEACKQIKERFPNIKVVFCTQQIDSIYVRAAFERGASGYVAKQSAGEELLQALQAAFLGQYYVTALAAAKPDSPIGSGSFRENPAGWFGANLTARQREVLQLVAEGKTNKEIAVALNISVKTVEFHRGAIMDVLGIRTTAELTRYAITQKMVDG